MKYKELCEQLNISADEINIKRKKTVNKMYHNFLIPKKSGGERIISAPNDQLKIIQKRIKEIFLDKLPISIYAHGFVNGRSIVTNAIIHTKKNEVYNIDIHNFFPSITEKKVYIVFNKIMKLDNNTSKYLTNLCTYNGRLPQGAPTSPVLSNIVSKKLDKRLGAFAAKNGLNFTRYADDITFSGNRINTYQRSIIKKIIIDEGFVINKNKERLQKSYDKQIVTGLIVNDKLKVNSKLIMELKNAIYYSMKFGVLNHMKFANIDFSFYKEHLYGMAYFVKMVDSQRGDLFLNQLDDIAWPY